jgi:hypothetical protein
MISSDEARIRADEEKIRAALTAAGQEEGGSVQSPIAKTAGYGRNDLITVKKGDETKVLKFKKAEPLLAEGWVIS